MLALETTTFTGSVAAWQDGALVAEAALNPYLPVPDRLPVCASA
jgi:hypothetical protein